LAHAALFVVSCLAVSLIEETLARGILFRSLARVWTPLWAAVVISAVFGTAHYLRPLREAFTDGPLFATTWAVLSSMPDYAAGVPLVGLRMFNLFLMSMVLCAFVVRTRTIWLAVGTHAGWVWVKRMNDYLSDSARDVSVPLWLGQKTDGTDSLLATAFLLLLMAWALWAPARGHKPSTEIP
jgi:membrane protease YdiL (CAAX protease family)